MSKFKAGDIVKHKASFLQSVQWYTNVPLDGRVVEVDGDIVTVEWSDGHSARINQCNIMPRNKPDYTGL